MICVQLQKASYNFYINNSITSFQGEYPYELALDKKYSFSLLTFKIRPRR